MPEEYQGIEAFAETRRALVVAAHADDMETMMGGTLARLVAQGLTDRQIAEQLVLARRTAEGHVQQALRKLGFTSRQQLAGWVVEHQISS